MPGGQLFRGLRAQIADRLRDDILAGRMMEGERLSETKLAERFDVSRGPIREALVQLTHEGFLVGKPNCGVSVAPSAPASIKNLIIPIRQTIETFALTVIVDDLKEEDFQKWDEILDRLETACKQKDFASTAENDIAFHRFLLKRAGQADLLAIWSTIVARVRSHFRQTHLDYAEPIKIYEEHRAIVEAVRKGRKKEAFRLLKNNIE